MVRPEGVVDRRDLRPELLVNPPTGSSEALECSIFEGMKMASKIQFKICFFFNGRIIPKGLFLCCYDMKPCVSEA